MQNFGFPDIPLVLFTGLPATLCSLFNISQEHPSLLLFVDRTRRTRRYSLSSWQNMYPLFANTRLTKP